MQNNTANKYPAKDVSYLEGVTVFLFAIVANLAAQLVIGIVAEGGAIATGNENFASGDYFQLISMAVLQLAFFAVPAIYFGFVKKVSPRLLCPVRKPEPSLAFALLLPILCLIGFMLPALYFVTGLEKIGFTLSEGVNLNTAGKWVLGVLVIVILAPCVEELIFRGFLLSGLQKNFSPIKAALLSALAFMLMHMNPEQTVYQFCLGFVCGLAVVQSGNLLAGMIVHMCSNLLALLVDTPAGKPYNDMFAFLTKTTWGAVLSTILLAAACGVAVWFVCVALRKYRRKSEQPAEQAEPQAEQQANGENNGESNGENTATPPQKNSKKMGLMIYLAGIGLCVVLWVFVLVAGLI